MSSPRWLRPHTITIRNKFPEEVGGKSSFKETVLRHVKFQGKAKDQLSREDTEVQDEYLVTIDCHDMEEVFIPFDQWDTDQKGFTVHPEGDEIEYKGQIYVITSFVLINPFRDDPEFIEITCQR